MTPDLLDVVFEHDEIAQLDPAERRLALRSLVIDSGCDDVPAAVQGLVDAIDGFGPLSGLMRSPGVTDILVNGPGEVWVERDGRLERTDISFPDPDRLLTLIDVLVGRGGVRVDASRPVADARLSDGSRLHVVLPPVAPQGPLLSIRRFPHRRLSLADLAGRGMVVAHQVERFRTWVAERNNIAISGATGSGKTTLLNALLGEVGDGERVVLVEETPELAPACGHVVSLVARGSNVEGRGELPLPELARAALRMRPDRIVVGEARGPEMLTALDAMTTGHEGSMVTVHARSASGAIQRMATLACRGARWLSRQDAVDEVCEAVDVIVHLTRTEGARRVAEVLEL